MLKLYFLRHGQTEYNLQERVHGWNDAPLTQLGIFQAKCAGYGARKILFDAAFSGDIKRQIVTGETFLSQNEHPVPVIADFHFREMGYGKYEDGTYVDMLMPVYEELDIPYEGYEGLYSRLSGIELSRKLQENDETGTFEGPDKAKQRLLEGIELLKEKYRDGNILISTSSFAIELVINALFPGFIQERLVGNGSLTVVGCRDDGHELLAYDDRSCREEGEHHFRSNG